MVGWQRRVRLGMVFAALATLALLAGCNLPGQQTSDLANDQTLKIVLPLDGGGENPLANLDPAQGLYPPYLQASSLLFDGLLTLDRNGHVEPWGAQSWTVSPDGLAYTFTLRPHQRFSDGAPVKASDYAWSIDRIANPCLSLFNYDSSVFTDYSFLALVKDAPAFHNETCARGQPTGAITSLIGDALLPNDSLRHGRGLHEVEVVQQTDPHHARADVQPAHDRGPPGLIEREADVVRAGHDGEHDDPQDDACDDGMRQVSKKLGHVSTPPRPCDP